MTITLFTFVILAFTTFHVCAIGGASINCGTTNFTRGLISKGTKTSRGEWPFLAALIMVEENMFFCGGTLISSKHVLTAAHCIQQKESRWKLLPSDIFVLLGAYDLTSKIERGVQRQGVEEIHTHPEWRTLTDKYDADLAILLLSKIVLFTNYIRPVCLPAHDDVFDDVSGSVVGWGLTETETGPNKEFIKHAFVTALNGVYCLTEDPIVATFSSTRTFCGRGDNGNANSGDSGGGFYVLFGSAWLQYGIVSAMRSNAAGYVDSNSIVVYTNVLKFKYWIVDIVAKSGVTVGEANTNVETKINLECEFAYGTDNKYECWVDNLNIRNDNIAIASFTGSHLNENIDQDVELIQFRSGTMFFIPSEVGEIFENVRILKVNENLSTKLIKRSDFNGLENLVELDIAKNQLRTLDYNCLRDLEKLEVFGLHDNSLTEINGLTFETNVKIREISLYGNKLEVLPRNLFKNNVLLEIVYLYYNSLKMIDGTTFENNVQLKEVYLGGNKLEVLPRNLFENNLLLEIVSLYDNSLKMIDGTTFQANIKLSKLWLYGNKIDILPKNVFTNNSLLDFFSLYDNSLKMIDGTTFETNVELTEVSLFGNKLEILPKNLFSNNLLLEIVFLYYNSMQMIDETTFQNNAKLKEVFMGGNKLVVLPRNLFKNNLLLEIVSLYDNSFDTIDEATFETNMKLRKVWLHGNKIEVLPRHLFSNNLLLEFVNFDKNSLKIIKTDFTIHSNIKQIYLYDNICIDAYYEGDDIRKYRSQFRNLTEFQNIVRANCSSANR